MATALVGQQVTYSDYQSVRYFSALDGLRAISVIAVIWQHTAGYNQSGGILSRGYLGVDMFFAISGFLITTLLLREHRRNGRISLRRFYLRRALRIFPIYYVVLLAYVGLVFATQWGTAAGREFMDNLPAFATYTSNWFGAGGDHATFYFAWSLATEEQFYLFWPPLVAAVWLYATMRDRVTTAAGILAVLIVVDQVASVLGDATPLRILASLATPILLGAFAAVVIHSPNGYDTVAEVLGGRWTAVGVAAVTVVAIHFRAPDVVAQVLFAVLVTALCVREDTAAHPVLTWRPVVLVGTISYGIYLMHMLAANAARIPLGHSRGIDVFLVTTPLVIASAYVSYRWFESPIRSLGRQAAGPVGHSWTTRSVGTGSPSSTTDTDTGTTSSGPVS